MKEINYLCSHGPDLSNTNMYSERVCEFMFPAQEKKITDIQVTRTSFREGDVVFFSNHVDFPRFKFREWAHSRGIRIAKRPKNANVIIVDKTYLQDTLKRGNETTISKQWIDSATLNVGWIPTTYMEQILYIEPQSTDEVIGYKSVEIPLRRFNTYKKHTNALEQASILSQYASDDVEFMDFPVFTKLVAENTLLTRDFFWDLYRMMKGSDKENQELAIEMLTNINIDLSRYRVDLLIYSNLNIIRCSNVWNKVTFKPVRYYMENKLSAPTFNRSDLEDERSCLLLVRKLRNSYEMEDRLHEVDHVLLKEILQPIVREKMIRSVNDLNELNLENITFSLNSEIYPKQIKKILDVQEKQISGSPIRKNVQEPPTEILSEYSDEQE